ncbi:MAG: hypothetical protein P1U77_11865 [Rubripirellula sp.]|jgi:hypothetical protein|nr:hypothetical protein [Rubripirellula sp.]
MRFLSVFSCAFALALFGSFASTQAEEAKVEKVSVFNAGELVVPADFKRVQPQSRILEHEFQAKAGDGDDAATARLTMMGAGGDVAANIQRWKGQFVGGDPAKQKVEEMKLGDWKVHLVDVSGSYAERTGGGPFAGGKVVNRKDYAMAGAILVHPEGRKYFLKLIGPGKVVKANREAFVKMIKSLDE